MSCRESMQNQSTINHEMSEFCVDSLCGKCLMLDLSEAFRIYLTLFHEGLYSETLMGRKCRRLRWGLALSGDVEVECCFGS